MEQWEDWGAESNALTNSFSQQDYANHHNYHQQQQQTDQENLNGELDFFSDMTPQYKKAAKVGVFRTIESINIYFKLKDS